ncbi:MAG: hypothetical protein QOI13_201, partial [Paraburkholderia sp.]|nr:hypothetical protein [Paraburkholderia sp.]
MTMRRTSPLVTLRRLSSYALIAAVALAFAGRTALAQRVPQPNAPVATQNADPPGRVGRLNFMAGTVTMEPAGATDWSYASIERPLTTGDQLWNDESARSELHIGSTAVRLGASTNLDILNLDDANAQLKVTQGTLSTHVRELAPGSSYEIDTPNVALAPTRPGDYRVDVAPDGSTTTVTVRSGALTVYGDNGQMPLSAGERITFSGTSLQENASEQAPPPDAFDQWAVSRDAAEDRSISARYVSRDVPGYEDLDANGTWRSDPEYGDVWVPSAVPVGWAPYHYGQWAWIAPWGWTWVDDAPWGFAPYHYGRWAYARSSWCWVPGPRYGGPPVYAPALVAFVGDWGGGRGRGRGRGEGAAPGVAWFPLGPHDAWRPHYGGWSPRYYDRVNRSVTGNPGANSTHVRNTYANFRAPGAVTAVPTTAFVQGRPVAPFAQRVDPQQWHNAQITSGAPGIAPVRESFTPGLRPATHRPPQSLSTRQVIATHAPSLPAVYHDSLAQRLAQSGGRVPGAGKSLARITPPAGVAAELQHPGANAGAARNVRVIGRGSPTVMQAHGLGPAGQRPAAGPGGTPAGARPGVEPPRRGSVEQHPPVNGVPRPPNTNAFGPTDGGGPTRSGSEPGRTQQHVPVTQQHAPVAPPQPQPGEANRARQAGAPQIERGAQSIAPRPGIAAEPAQSTHAPQAVSRQPNVQVQPRVDARAQPQLQPPMEPRLEPRARAQPQPRVEPQPQPQAPQRMEMRPPPKQPQPRVEMRAPPQPQPRVEMRPPPQPQPRVETRPPPQPQPRVEMRPPPQQPQP